MKLLGKPFAEKIYNDLKDKIEQLDFKPLVADLVVGNDPVSLKYVELKQKKAQALGFEFEIISLPLGVETNEVIQQIENFAKKPQACGLLVQLPLPEGLDDRAILDAIPEELDVDVLGKKAQARFYKNFEAPYPPTIAAIMTLLKSVGATTKQKIAVVGQGNLVGKPLTNLLGHLGFDVVSIDKDTENPELLTKDCDILISGVGKPGLITSEWIKPGTVLIDAGTAEVGGSIIGDLSDTVTEIASFIAPVPGGVGPLTIAHLLENAYNAFKKIKRI